MKVEVPELKLWIKAEARDKINQWVGMAKGEVSGLGLVLEEPDGFFVYDVFLPFQDCGGADTTIEPGDVAKLMMEVEEQGQDSSALKFWWHSHVNLPVFWSGTDKNTIDGFRPRDFFISSVFNKMGKVKTRVDYYDPLRMTLHDLDTVTSLPEFNQRQACKEVFDARVKEGMARLCGPSLFPIERLGHEEIINKYATGEIAWVEAERMIEELDAREEEIEYWRGWGDEF